MAYSYLSHRAVIKLSGEEIIEFLQGLISNDARKLTENRPVYAALLSPQGKFLHDFILVPQGDSVLLDTEASRAADLISKLKIYRLRSKIVIESSDIKIATIWGEDTMANEYPAIKTIEDPRLPELGLRIYGTTEAIDEFCAREHIEEGDYENHRLSLGVPDGSRDMIPEKSLLLECGFEELHGVDFNKGCYVGQEVTARSKFRGQVRKSFYIVTGNDLPDGGEIKAGELVIGELRSSSVVLGLARLNTEAADDVIANDTIVTCAGIEVKISVPTWRIAQQNK